LRGPGEALKKIVITFCLLLFSFTLVACYWYFFMRNIVYSDDSRFKGGLLDVAPQISGMLKHVIVGEGDEISQGQLLFVIDRVSSEASVAKAEAYVKSAQAGLDVAKAGYEKSVNGPLKKEIKIAADMKRKMGARLKLLKAEWERVNVLYKEKATSAFSMEKTRASWEIARHSYEEAKSRLNLLKGGTRTEDLAAARANVELKKELLASARASEREARIKLDRTEVRASSSGIVVRRWKNPGGIIAVGQPVLTVFDPSELYVAANIKEKFLRRVNEGDSVTISVDAYPDLKLKGRVDKVLRATNSQFGLIPSESAGGTYVKVAQRVPVKILLEKYPELPLGPGLSVVVRIHTNTASVNE